MAFKLTNDQMVELQNSRNLFPDPVVGNSLAARNAAPYRLILSQCMEGRTEWQWCQTNANYSPKL